MQTSMVQMFEMRPEIKMTLVGRGSQIQEQNLEMKLQYVCPYWEYQGGGCGKVPKRQNLDQLESR